MSGQRAPLAERMAAAARELQDEHDPQATMDTAVRLAASNVRGADAAAISLVHRRRDIDTPAYTDDFAVICDKLQYELREGPCLDAIMEQRIVHSVDLCTDERWPTWGPRVADEVGIRSMLCFRLFTHEDTVGGLNLYAMAEDAFDDQDHDDGLALAAHIAIAVAGAQQVQHLSVALDSRTVIGKAVGIMMERYDMTDELAFAALARVSSQTNVPVRELAAELVETRKLPTTE